MARQRLFSSSRQTDYWKTYGKHAKSSIVDDGLIVVYPGTDSISKISAGYTPTIKRLIRGDVTTKSCSEYVRQWVSVSEAVLGPNDLTYYDDIKRRVDEMLQRHQDPDVKAARDEAYQHLFKIKNQRARKKELLIT